MTNLKNKKVVAIIPARSDSTRLPKKHLREAAGHTMLYYMADRLSNAESIDQVVLATTERSIDNELAEAALQLGVEVYRGDLDNVIGRFAKAFNEYEGDIAIKANGDNPLLGIEVIEKCIQQLNSNGVDLVTAKEAYTGIPIGLGAEILTRNTVEWLDQYTPEFKRDDTTRYVFEEETPIKWESVKCSNGWVLPGKSITVDTQDDFNFFEKVIKHLPDTYPRFWTTEMIVETLKEIN